MVSLTPWPLYPRERPGIHRIGGWVDPRAGLDGCGKSRSSLGFDPRTAQPVASSLYRLRLLNNNTKLFILSACGLTVHFRRT